MNTTKKRIMDRYEDLLNAIDAVKESPTSLILLSKFSGFKLFLKVSLKSFVISLINGIIFIG